MARYGMPGYNADGPDEPMNSQHTTEEQDEMPERLNGVIKQLEAGKHVHVCFGQPDRESALAVSTSNYDAVVFEMEHNPWDIAALRDGLQWMLNRKQIIDSGSLAPKVTPIVRIPPNGVEQNQLGGQAGARLGVYGIVWPHISSVEQAYSAVGACRYPRLKDKPYYEPAGIRGDAPARRRGTGASATRTTTRLPTSGRSTPTARSWRS